MEYVKLKGIVAKSLDYLEGDKLLTILTFEKGMVTVKAKGVRKKGARLSHCSRQFFCGDFECVAVKGRYILTGGSRLYDFSEISADIDNFYHACHYLDIASSVIMEDHPDEEMLRLLLNTLFMLTKGNDISLDLLTVFFEMRTSVISGFAPVTDECAVCGSVSKGMSFSIEHGGTVCCTGGLSVEKHIVDTISRISECTMKELFSLKVADSSIPELKSIAHEYLEYVMDRSYNTLDGINNI